MAVGNDVISNLLTEFWPDVKRKLFRRHDTEQYRPRPGHEVTVLVILALNILIVWYLFQNRQRLFRHHHH